MYILNQIDLYLDYKGVNHFKPGNTSLRKILT